MSKYTVGRAVREARRLEDIGVRELARRSGISAGQISRIENGEVQAPEYPTLEALAGAMDRQVQALEVLTLDFEPAGVLELAYERKVRRTWDPDEPYAPWADGTWAKEREEDHAATEGESVPLGSEIDPYLPFPTNEGDWAGYWPEGELHGGPEVPYEEFRHFAYDYFLCMTSAYILEGIEPWGDRQLMMLLRLWSRLTYERRDRVVLCVAEQASLSSLERKDEDAVAVRAQISLFSAEGPLRDLLPSRVIVDEQTAEMGLDPHEPLGLEGTRS